jgi:tetratricopeptide (TPR) repeat protein
MKRLLFILVISLFSAVYFIYGQTEKQLEEYFNEGQYFFNRGDFEDAVFYYLKLVAEDSLNANFNFKVGESYLNIPGKEHLAIPYFEIAQKKIVSKNSYRRRALEEKSAPLHVYFYLGNAYRMNNQLNEALECYMKFIDSPFFHNNYNLNVVDNEIKSCERAKIIQDAPLRYEKINLGNAINSDFNEEKPVLSGDGTTLVFVRRLKFYDAVFCSRKLSGEWQQAENINPQIISDGEFYPSGLSHNGTEMILVKKEGDSYDLYQSSYDGNTWSKAVKLPGRINSVFSETHASFGPDDQSLYITSDRKGGKGGLDIWISERKEDGSWGAVRNLKNQINTELDEQMAYRCRDHDVLFFSSKGHYTMGGSDIFYSVKNGRKWKIPVNLGYPINDTRDNYFYCPSSLNCREGYSAIIDKEGFGGSDIFLLRIQSENILFISRTDAGK